jgi:hypothetical protein
MADPPRYSNSREHTGGDTATPRWVKAAGIISIVLALLVAIMMFIGGGGHGPGRHTPSGDAARNTPLSSVTELGGPGGHTPLMGGH